MDARMLQLRDRLLSNPKLLQVRDQLLNNRKALVASLAMLLLLFVGTLVAGYHLVKRSIEDSRVTARSMNTPTKVGLLLEDQRPGDVLNHIVYFNDVRLESGPADNVYYAVGAEGKRLLVVALGSKSVVGEDAPVDIEGTVRALPPSSEMRKKWKLDKEEIKAVRDQGIFIEADSIQAKKGSPRSLAKK
jgi:hypothetical protein